MNTDYFGTEGAGIGKEFGHAFDMDTNTWFVWHWADGTDNDFPEGDYDLFVI